MNDVAELKKLLRDIIDEFSCASWAADWEAQQRLLRKAQLVLGDDFPPNVYVHPVGESTNCNASSAHPPSAGGVTG